MEVRHFPENVSLPAMASFTPLFAAAARIERDVSPPIRSAVQPCCGSGCSGRQRAQGSRLTPGKFVARRPMRCCPAILTAFLCACWHVPRITSFFIQVIIYHAAKSAMTSGHGNEKWTLRFNHTGVCLLVPLRCCCSPADSVFAFQTSGSQG